MGNQQRFAFTARDILPDNVVKELDEAREKIRKAQDKEAERDTPKNKKWDVV